MIKREQIENTPFWIVGNDEYGYKITWGKYAFNEHLIPTEQETHTWFNTHTWEIIMHVVAIAIQAEKATKDINKPE